ncbi:unnamed protein product [Linum trigynum]|uniref:Uncharacterized protein n=1 Tax=Linum trigynum TaxID=586398 RepID=A0AAV2GWD9_9ROSI
MGSAVEEEAGDGWGSAVEELVEAGLVGERVELTGEGSELGNGLEGAAGQDLEGDVERKIDGGGGGPEESL